MAVKPRDHCYQLLEVSHWILWNREVWDEHIVGLFYCISTVLKLFSSKIRMTHEKFLFILRIEMKPVILLLWLFFPLPFLFSIMLLALWLVECALRACLGGWSVRAPCTILTAVCFFGYICQSVHHIFVVSIYCTYNTSASLWLGFFDHQWCFLLDWKGWYCWYSGRNSSSLQTQMLFSIIDEINQW